jgi:predicted neuraminidase
MRTLGLAVCLVFAAGFTVCAAPSEKALFETGVVAASDPSTAALNGLPNIVATPSGRLIAAWSVWAAGHNPKLRIVTARSADGGKTWSPPATRIDNPGKTDADANFVVDGKRILLLSTTVPEPGRIVRTEIWLTASEDDGDSWSAPVLVRQPRKYTVGKVHVGHKLPDGRLAVGYSWDIFCERDMVPRTEGEMDLKSGFMFSSDGGKSWRAGGDIYARPPKMTPYSTNGLDEPASVILDGGEVYALLRSGTTRLWEARSQDGGETWSEPLPSPLTGHNAPAALWRLRGTQDVVVVWDNSPRNRYPLAAALSEDGCNSWSRARVLAASPGRQASYPSIAESAGGVLVAVWQQDLADRKGREIRYARFNKAWLLGE